MSDDEFIKAMQYLRGYLHGVIASRAIDDEDNPEHSRAVEVGRFAVELVAAFDKQWKDEQEK